MKRTYYAFFLLFEALYVNNSFAQIPDDEFSLLRKEISIESNKSPLSGIKKVDEILTKFNAQLAKHQQIRLLYLKSWYQISSDRIEEALSTLEQTRLLAKEITEPGILYSYYGITASAYTYIESYELAIDNYMKAYKEAPLLKQPQYIQQTENNIGHVYLKLGLLDKAEYYFNRFYTHAVKNDLFSQQGVGLNNLGETAFYRGEFYKAEEFHQKALALRKKHGYEYHQSWSMYNLGRVYFAKNELDEAEQFLNLAIERLTKQNAKSKALMPKIELARMFISQNQPLKAEKILEEVVLLSKDYKKLSTLKEALTEIATLKRLKGDFESALSSLDERNTVVQQIAERKSSIGLAHMVSQTELQTIEMALQQLEQEHQLAMSIAKSEKQIGLILLLSFMLLTSITSFFLYRLNRKRLQLQNLLTRLKRTQDKLVESEKMRAMTTLVSGMAHQLNTPLGLVITANSSLQSQVEVLTNKLTDKSLTQVQLSHFLNESNELINLSQRNSERAAEMIQTFKMMSAKLQMNERRQFEVLGFLRNKVPQIIRTYNQSIQYQITGKEFVISSYSSVLLKVINQFIENSVRHGFEEIETPLIKISVNIKLNEIEIHYSDNGVGIEQEKRSKIFDPFYTTRLSDGNLGLGLNIIYNSVVHIMHGQVECLGDDEGAHFLIVLPKNISSETVE